MSGNPQRLADAANNITNGLTENAVTESFASGKAEIKRQLAKEKGIILISDMAYSEIYFDGEKLGDDAILFEAIAPYVKKGSFIEMNGEDGCIWQWQFNGKTCIEKAATVSFI